MLLNTVEAGTGDPLVILHGLFGAARNWGAIGKRLSARRRVLAMDLRNHGASPRADAMDYASMAADVAETAEAAGAVPAAVLGHSMGGKAAMALALTRPGAVSRLLVADIAPVPYPPRQARIVAAMRAVPLRPGLTRREADAALSAEGVQDAATRAFLLQNLRIEGGAPSWRCGLDEIAATMGDIEGFPDFSARYEGPTLFLLGERSDYVQAEHRPRIRALFPAARFLSLRGTGHWLHAEKPEEFTAVAESFFQPAGA
ncbi:MAG: alpha/beta fold hydrolase [Acetobacteraceae bacterium]|nr:alpha/beta fold hydrolase [Acetobacteraceae bacterium]